MTSIVNMKTNQSIKDIYHDAIDDSFAYEVISLRYNREVGVGTSKPLLYSSCSDFASDCSYISTNNCKSFIVKKGIGINHEFIDSPLAALFLNHNKMKIFLTIYPRDGYSAIYIQDNQNDDKLTITGTASPLICSFQSITDIIKRHKAADSNNNKLNINLKGFHLNDYLDQLRKYFSKTDAQSITDYYISQYISGGGDPNSGNFGFAEIYPAVIGQHKYVIAKVDLGASFKNYSEISGSKPSLVSNKYAFNLPDNVQNFQQLYNHLIQDGNILMPGEAYECKERSHICQWSGQGNVGLYNGQYKRSNAYGINIGTYVKTDHLNESLTKLCKVSKEDIISIFNSSSYKIYNFLYSTQERKQIPIINDSEVIFSKYVDGRADFIVSRIDRLCHLFEESNPGNNNEQPISNQPISYEWYEDSSTLVLLGMAIVGVVGLVLCWYSMQPHEHNE